MSFMDIRGVLKSLPHTHPFVLVDRLEELEPNKTALGLKNVTYNEPFFPGHFPANPVMPGVLCLEALAQVSGILLRFSPEIQKTPDDNYFLARIDEARFKRKVVPGDQLLLRVTIDRWKASVVRFSCKATVGGVLAAQAEITLVGGSEA